jgi:hypothetical protein
MSISLGRQRGHSPEVDTPKFSFGVHPHTTAKSSRLLTQKTVKPCTAGTAAVKDGNATQCNVDFSNNSYDLQHTCHQLSTVVVSRAGGSRFENCAKPFKTARLFQENLNPLTDVPDKNLDGSFDPLGDDIMAKVMAIGKESENQAVIDAGGKIRYLMALLAGWLLSALLTAPASRCNVHNNSRHQSTMLSRSQFPRVLLWWI